jgi:hypothetical protein
MKLKSFFPFLLMMMFAKASVSQVNYSEHIAPIIYTHCTSCHRTGEIGPFPLTNFNEVAAWSGMIKYVTQSRYMPPWKPDPEFKDFRKANYLTQQEIDLIAQWVDDGAPQGNPQLEPGLPQFPTGSQIGTPDLVLSFAQSHTVKGNNKDEYRYFVIPTGLTTNKKLVALEIRPGNSRVVHHTLVWQDTSGQAAASDAATPEYGYIGGGGAANFGTQLPGYVPGQKPILYSNGMAQTLSAGADLVLQMHYAPTPVDEVDSTTINLFFADGPAPREVLNYIMLPFGNTLTNGPFVVQPNQVKTFHGRYTAPLKVSLIGIAPHCHLLGKDWTVYAVTPTNDTLNLISIPDWDFNWQGSYYYKSPIVIPAGSVLHAYGTYDNTTNNPFNPANPPVTVSWGEGTNDEMFYLPFIFTVYQAGDENIVFEEDSLIVGNASLLNIESELLSIIPNPAQNQIMVSYTLHKTIPVKLAVYQMDGKEVGVLAEEKMHFMGMHRNVFDISTLSNGSYILQMEAGNKKYQQRLLIAR